ncbi:MAG: tripartite tricarboxylate transporter substrate binding protein [Betaproteobacteria bacterium]|nr:tripartite tricarboxylate transporter substrate binding protein [Betaproteobacteria bacterium]
MTVRSRWLMVGALAAAVACTSHAQPYPNRPIRLIVPSAPGGAPDISARMYGQEVSRQVGQQVVVDNRAGASGSIGFGLVAKAPADGYTIGYATFPLATNPSMLPTLRYDALRDLQMVVHLASTPNVLVVQPALPVKSVQELIDYAKGSPGKLHYSSGGSGTSLHLAMALLISATGAQFTHVPYKGVDQATIAVIGGEAQVMFHNITPILPHVRAGRVRGLAVTTLKRVASVPDLPTVAESGVPGYEIAPWGGIMAPAGIPRPLLDRLNAEFNIALKSKTVQDTYAAAGVEPQGGTPEQFTEHVRRETERWSQLIKRLGIKGG